MLKGETITSMREFVSMHYPIINDHNRWAFTHYVIEYDGTNEVKQDISRFVGGFQYGDLTLVDTALMSQYRVSRDRPGPFTRKLEECIMTISVGDWVCLSCGKFFLIPKDSVQECIDGWLLEEIPYDLERFREYYANEWESLGYPLYQPSYRTNKKEN